MLSCDGGVIYVNCGYLVGPFNYPWNAEPRPITLRGFDTNLIDFAWFMKGLSSASTAYPAFDEDNPYLAETLYEWLADNSFADRIATQVQAVRCPRAGLAQAGEPALRPLFSAGAWIGAERII